MRNVPPGIQIILSISEGLSQIATSDVSLAAGCAVIKALPPPTIDMHLSGNTLRRRILERYWPVVQYRPQLSAVPSSALVLRPRRRAIQSAPRANVAPLILLTEFNPPCHHRPTIDHLRPHP